MVKLTNIWNHHPEYGIPQTFKGRFGQQGGWESAIYNDRLGESHRGVAIGALLPPRPSLKWWRWSSSGGMWIVSLDPSMEVNDDVQMRAPKVATNFSKITKIQHPNATWGPEYVYNYLDEWIKIWNLWVNVGKSSSQTEYIGKEHYISGPSQGCQMVSLHGVNSPCISVKSAPLGT